MDCTYAVLTDIQHHPTTYLCLWTTKIKILPSMNELLLAASYNCELLSKKCTYSELPTTNHFVPLTACYIFLLFPTAYGTTYTLNAIHTNNMTKIKNMFLKCCWPHANRKSLQKSPMMMNCPRFNFIPIYQNWQSANTCIFQDDFGDACKMHTWVAWKISWPSWTCLTTFRYPSSFSKIHNIKLFLGDRNQWWEKGGDKPITGQKLRFVALSTSPKRDFDGHVLFFSCSTIHERISLPFLSDKKVENLENQNVRVGGPSAHFLVQRTYKCSSSHSGIIRLNLFTFRAVEAVTSQVFHVLEKRTACCLLFSLAICLFNIPSDSQMLRNHALLVSVPWCRKAKAASRGHG